MRTTYIVSYDVADDKRLRRGIENLPQFWQSSSILGFRVRLESIIPPLGGFSLGAELASWLNEQGWPGQGLEQLKRAQKLFRGVQPSLRPKDISRFERQFAIALMQTNQNQKHIEAALSKSRDCGDKSENNEFAIYNAQLTFHVSKQEPKKALEVLEKRFEYAEKSTDYFFGSLVRSDPSIQTSLVGCNI
jgi:hypothetical protein